MTPEDVSPSGPPPRCTSLPRSASNRYGAALVNRGANPAPARRLLDFLASPRAARRFRQCGFLTPRARS
jgi:ABC-type molybdate transport system substrate-binding protein